MRYLLTTTFAAMIGLLMVQPAQAASPAGNSFYGSVSGGPLFTQEFEFGNPSVQVSAGPPARNAGFVIDVEPDVGYSIEGAAGGWIGSNYRSEIAVGWRSYETDSSLRAVGLEADNPMTPDEDESGTIEEAQAAYLVAAGITAEDATIPGELFTEVSTVHVSWNNYFHVLEGAHQPWFGFGLGVGFTTIDAPNISDSFKTSVLLSAMAGYDFYLSGLSGNIKSQVGDVMGGSGILDDIVVGVGYRFSWANPKPSGSNGNSSFIGNSEIRQSAHSVLFNVRYEF